MTKSQGPPPLLGANPVVRAGWMMAAGFSILLIGMLGVGFALPGSWSARTTRVVAAPPERVFDVLAEPRRWDEWTPWPDVEFTYEGPDRGVGATRRWDDPRLGAGTFTLTEADSPRLVRYEVIVGGGDLVTSGVLRLEREPAGTRVTWEEAGDMGWNPLLSYAALMMGERQREELRSGLERLATVVEAR